MAELDGSINDPTPTTRMADRLEVWAIALSALRAGGLNPEADEVLSLAEFLAGTDFA